MKIFKKLFYSCIFLGLIILLRAIFVNLSVENYTQDLIFDSVELLPEEPVDAVLILGARVYSNGTISEIYLERINTAINVYQNGNAKNILVSADNSRADYDEVRPVAKYLVEQGIPVEDEPQSMVQYSFGC